jgi:hypothetical protein
MQALAGLAHFGLCVRASARAIASRGGRTDDRTIRKQPSNAISTKRTTSCRFIGATSSTSITSPDASEPSEASTRTNSPAKPGHHSRNDSQPARSPRPPTKKSSRSTQPPPRMTTRTRIALFLRAAFSQGTARTSRRRRTPADHSSHLLSQACLGERSELDRLRQQPSAEAAGLFWRDMQC